MPAKVTDPPTGVRKVDRWDGGVGWMPHPEEIMQRTSHALMSPDGVWLVDPLDAPGIDDLIDEYGDVAGIVLLSNYHWRDADVFARRYDVAVHVPSTMADVPADTDLTVRRVPIGHHFGGYELREVATGSLLGAAWDEYALYDGETLVVGESVGCAPYFRVGDERLGMMLLRRFSPPRTALADLDPARVVSGHGSGVHDGASEALADTLANARRRLPRALLAHGLAQVRSVVAAART